MEPVMLNDIELFADLDEQEFANLAHKAVTRQYPRNTVVINEGDISDSLYILLEGTVKVFLSNEDGKEVILNTQGPGDYFGEMALLDPAPRSASVMTTEKSKLSIIAKPDFEAFLRQHPEAMLKILCRSIKRLRALTDTVGSLALLDVYGRVARLLLKLAETEGEQKIVKAEFTQQDIANRIGSSREMVSRILKDLRTGGYIEMRDRHIILRRELPHAW
jgi:CRP/FNR family cyclic AMP-dependent transcriptional regulator